MNCPSCGSDRLRRGGTAIWSVYIALIALAVLAVLVFDLNGAIVAAIIICAIVAVHLTIGGKVCLECGHQFR